MVNRVSYAFSMSSVMEPFRYLLKPGNAFVGSPLLRECFEDAKRNIISAVKEGVQHFEVNRPTCVATDWSKGGIGFTLRQKWCKCKGVEFECCPDGLKINLMGGRFTSPAESRYETIEGETLAMTEALQKFKYFVLGCPELIVATDHKPLVGVVKGHLSDISNPLLLAIVKKTLWFKFNIVHVPGKDNPAPDFMSRCTQDKQAGLALIYSDQECWDVESPIITSVTQALNCDMGDRAVTFSRV